MIDNPIYTKAYTEVNCLLQYLPQSYLDKLPKKLMELICDQSDTQYNIYIDTNKSLLEQNFSDKAIALIAVLKYNYWSTDEEKQQLEKIFYENENAYQEELVEEYNPDNIFKKKKTENIDTNLQIVEYKENVFIQFFNKIKNLFRKR
jgi:hypothetical protein